jgi:UDP-N-acetylmuramate--alanine ligase
MEQSYHFIGIGGIGMSAVAALLLRRGIRVSGSDLKDSKITKKLKSLGAQIYIGHDPKNIQEAPTIVYSSAIKEDNPEIQEARRKGLNLIKRAQALANLMQDKTVITVTGSHGKTTTASLVSYLLLEAGFKPSIAIGGILRNIDANAFLGNGNFFIAEADESDGSFLYYLPEYSIITNIDREHLDYYLTFENELNTFKEFINRTKEGGCIFCCADDINLRKLLKDYKNRYILFGLNPDSDIYSKNIRFNGLTSEFDCYAKNKFIDRFHLSLGGEHNISNSLSVIALGLELNIDLEIIKMCLANYKGAHRRLEVKLNSGGLTVIDDYAHHPQEIRETLKAVKNLKKKRIIAVFQPHRYTRMKLLLEEFGRSFDLADYVVITDIYAAGESPIEGVSAKNLCDEMMKNPKHPEVIFLTKDKIVPHILEIIRPDDLVITLGAGDIIKVSDELVERFTG